MSYTQILYHIVFATKNRVKAMPEAHQESLYMYIFGIIKNRKAILYRINGMEDHIHILSSLHPTVALSDFIKEIKTASNAWMKENGNFPKFTNWADGYAALTYTYRDKDLIINYIKNQKEHHKTETFEDELKRLLKEHEIPFEDKYLF